MQKNYSNTNRKNMWVRRLGTIVVAIAIMLGGINFFGAFARIGSLDNLPNKAFADAGVSSVPTTLAELKAMSVENIAGLSKFDARDFNLVTPVRDQVSSKLCWAYSTIAVSETSILYSGIDSSVTKDTLKLSAENLGYSRFTRPADPLGNVAEVSGSSSATNWQAEAGESRIAIDILSEWCGAVSESCQFDVNGFLNAEYKLVEAVKISEADLDGNAGDTDDEKIQNNNARILAIKQAIAKYGAVTFSYNNASDNMQYYNPNSVTSTESFPHACAIIGWDDNIEKTSFQPGEASQNGGWIVKNSYSSLPYLYLSYDVRSDNCYALKYEKADSLDNNYFYDRIVNDKENVSSNITQMQNVSKVANIFEVKGEKAGCGEYLKSVSVSTNAKNTSAKISVFTGVTAGAPESGTKAYEKTVSFLNAGQNYVTLDNFVRLTKGELYSVVVELSDSLQTNGNKYVEVYTGVGNSYKNSGESWSKMNGVARVKAYTKMTELKDIKDAIINLPTAVSYVYDGSEHQPNIRVSYGAGASQVDLVLGRDYTVEYTNNIFASTNATVEISGIGEYYGTKSRTFTIQKAECPEIESSSIMQNSSGQLVITPNESARKLSDIQLPENWAWENGNITLSYLDQKVSARYIGSDGSSFKELQKEIWIKGIPSLAPKVDDEEILNRPTPTSPTNKKENDNSSVDPQNVIIILIVIFLAINIGIVVWINIVKNRRHIAMYEKKNSEKINEENDAENGENIKSAENSAMGQASYSTNVGQMQGMKTFQGGVQQNSIPQNTSPYSGVQQNGMRNNFQGSGMQQGGMQQGGMTQNAMPQGQVVNNMPQQMPPQQPQQVQPQQQWQSQQPQQVQSQPQQQWQSQQPQQVQPQITNQQPLPTQQPQQQVVNNMPQQVQPQQPQQVQVAQQPVQSLQNNTQNQGLANGQNPTAPQ